MPALTVATALLPCRDVRLGSFRQARAAPRCPTRLLNNGKSSQMRACVVSSARLDGDYSPCAQPLDIEHGVPQPYPDCAQPSEMDLSAFTTEEQSDSVPIWMQLGRKCLKTAVIFGMAMALVNPKSFPRQSNAQLRASLGQRFVFCCLKICCLMRSRAVTLS